MMKNKASRADEDQQEINAGEIINSNENIDEENNNRTSQSNQKI